MYSSGNKPRITPNNTVIKAIAYKEGMNPSDILTTPPYTLAFTVTQGTIPFPDETTLSNAITYINANPGAYTIDIAANSISTAPLPALANGVNLTLTGTGTITSTNANGDSLFTINANAALTLNGPTLHGGGGRRVVWIMQDGNFTMGSGLITGSVGSGYSSGGVAVYGGTFTMNGGTISGITSTSSGGGVYVVDDTHNGTFIMNGGTIENNTAYGGAGVYIADDYSNPGYHGIFTYNAGTIRNNTATSPATYGNQICKEINGVINGSGGITSASGSVEASGIYPPTSGSVSNGAVWWNGNIGE